MFCSQSYSLQKIVLPAPCNDPTAGYWSVVVAVKTERSEVSTNTTEGLYSQYGSIKLGQ